MKEEIIFCCIVVCIIIGFSYLLYTGAWIPIRDCKDLCESLNLGIEDHIPCTCCEFEEFIINNRTFWEKEDSTCRVFYRNKDGN